MNKENIPSFYEKYGMDGKFFHLTRDHSVEITVLGGGFDGDEIYIQAVYAPFTVKNKINHAACAAAYTAKAAA